MTQSNTNVPPPDELSTTRSPQRDQENAFRPTVTHGSASIPNANGSEATANYEPTSEPIPAIPQPPSDAPFPEVAGYEILGVLGRGGMGVVYKARHLLLKRIVALKVILDGAHSGDGQRQRFRAEAEAVARLQHPNIVQVHDVGEHEGLPFAALEYVDGGSLSDRLRRGAMDFREAARLVRAIALAVHSAHLRSIVHRDLKPANILLDSKGVPKVTDFGLARQMDRDAGQTQSGAVMGTPSYMSPEQAGGLTKHVGPASDIYSLGAILYECLSGRPPFHGSSIIATLDSVRTREPVAPHLHRIGTPVDLETICLKCLRKEPSRRYSSAEDLAADLDRWLNGEPILARPVSAPEKVWKWAKRRPALASLIVVIHLFLAALLGLGIWSYTSIREALTIANSEKLKSQRMSAGLAFDRGLALCQEGNIAAGLLWWAECLLVNPEEDRELADVVETNLAAWSEPLHVQRLIRSHDDKVRCVAYSPDGSKMVICEGGAVHFLHPATGEVVGEPLSQPGVITCVAISPDGTRLATGTLEKEARIWNLSSRKMLGQPIPQPDMVNALAFSRDGAWLVAATGFRAVAVASTARVWEVSTGKPISPPLPHAQSITGAFFHPDGDKVVTGGYEGVLRTWDISTGKEVDTLFRINAQILCLAPSADGSLVAVGCNNAEAHVIHITAKNPVSQPLRNSASVVSIAIHPDNGIIGVGCQDSFAQMWEFAAGKKMGRPLLHQNYVTGIAFDPNGKSLATGSEDKTTRLWDLSHSLGMGVELPELDCELELSHFDDNLVSARPRTRVVGSNGRPIPHWVWDYLCAAFSADGRYIATGSIDNRGYVFDATTGRLVGKPLVHNNWVRSVAISPDSRHVLTGSHDLSAQLWEIETGERVGSPIRHLGEVATVAISPDGTRALTGSVDKTARLWNLKTGTPIGPPMLHSRSVSIVAFSNDNRRIATASHNETRIWDAATALPLGPPIDHHYPVTGIRFSPSNDSLWTLSGEGAARSLPLPQAICQDAEMIQLWLQVLLAQQFDAGKSLSPLEPSDWRRRRTAVELGPLGARLQSSPEAFLNWRESQLCLNEFNFMGDSAFSHVAKLVKEKPMNWRYPIRHSALFNRYGNPTRRDAELQKAVDLAGKEPVANWLDERAKGFERLHQHARALWIREKGVELTPNSARAQNALGNCLARLGKFADARTPLEKAVAIEPEQIAFQRDLTMVHLALEDRLRYREGCKRLIALASKAGDRSSALTAVLACCLVGDSVPDWAPVVGLATHAASGHEADARVQVAALFRAGRYDEALRLPWSDDVRYAHLVWEWFFQGLLRHHAGKKTEGANFMDQKIKMVEFMDREFAREETSKIWSDWIYYVQCHVLQAEAKQLLQTSAGGK